MKSIWYIVLQIQIRGCDAPIYWMAEMLADRVCVCFKYMGNFRTEIVRIAIAMSSFLFVFIRECMCVVSCLGRFLPILSVALDVNGNIVTHTHAEYIAREACHNSLAAIFNNLAYSMRIRAMAPLNSTIFDGNFNTRGCGAVLECVCVCASVRYFATIFSRKRGRKKAK